MAVDFDLAVALHGIEAESQAIKKGRGQSSDETVIDMDDLPSNFRLVM
jgi:hypothetical protein